MGCILKCVEVVFYFFFILQTGCCWYSVETEIFSFCYSNGYKYVTFVNFPKLKTRELFYNSFKFGIRSRILNNFDFQLNHLDFLIIDIANQEHIVEAALEIISSHKIQRSLIIYHNHGLFKSMSEKHRKNSLFYLYDGKSKWSQVLLLKDNPKIIINEISFKRNGLAIV